MKARLILVSASPRRKYLLEQLKIPFEISPSNVHERWGEGSASSIAIMNAERKVCASTHFGLPNRILLGADTIVNLEGLVMGKPAGRESARRMIEKLSGRRHEVITGFCLVSFSYNGTIKDRCSEATRSEVQFQNLTRKSIRAYLDTNEWQGKAGAYAIQGDARSFVLEVTGEYENVVGLPVNTIRDRLGTVFSDYQLL